MSKKKSMQKPEKKARQKHRDDSWQQWTQKRKEEYDRNKEVLAAGHSKLLGGNEIMEKQGPSLDQQKKKRKRDERSKELSNDAQLKFHRRSDLTEEGVVSAEWNEAPVSVLAAKSAKQVTALTQKKKKKKMEREKSKLAQKKLQEARKSGVGKLEVCEVGESVDTIENPESTLDKAKNDSMKKAFPRSMLQTFKARELKLFLAEQGMSLKEWKKKRKEEYKVWKEAKETRKLKRLQKSKAAESCEENKEETSGKGRNYTVSIALPGSILDNAQSPELKTYLAGQIARAAAVFNVNEIVIFEETGIPSTILEDESVPMRLWHKQGSTQLFKILQFLECPQYLRKYFFPLQKDLQFAGVLNPLDLPHHLRITDVSPYREGVIMNKPVRDGKGSYAYIGFPKSAVIDKAIEPNVRVTIKLDEEQHSKKHFTGIAVSPSAPYKQDGIYWGYNIRLAENLGAVFSKCPFKEGYDLTVGTSDKGKDVDHCVLPPFKHLLIVFGGLKGLEASLEADETLTVEDPSYLFHHYLNTCPSQGSRTIRTEEAILITMSILRPKILQCQVST